jgi:hypothetical protein
MAFITHPLITIEKLKIGADRYSWDNMAPMKLLNLSNATAVAKPSAYTCMLV